VRAVCTCLRETCRDCWPDGYPSYPTADTGDEERALLAHDLFQYAITAVIADRLLAPGGAVDKITAARSQQRAAEAWEEGVAAGSLARLPSNPYRAAALQAGSGTPCSECGEPPHHHLIVCSRVND
jgi:hypothetical protein